MKCLEFFAGIGGFTTAFPKLEIAQALDIDRDAAAVYRSNYPHPYLNCEIASLPDRWFETHPADTWWMSPPCTPFTRKGNREDLTDPRCDALKRLITAAASFRPARVAFENVVGFETSAAFQWMREQWTMAGYSIDWLIHCPTEMGWPNRRPRFYALASLDPTERLQRPTPSLPTSLETVLATIHQSQPWSIEEAQALRLSPSLVEQYKNAIDIIDLENTATKPEQFVTNCFTSSYGKSIVKSGSYIKQGDTVRRFTPREIATLLGFPPEFILPDSLSRERLWHLLGNSLSILSVKSVFSNCLVPD